MTEVPRKHSLSEHLAEQMRSRINTGEFSGRLPALRELAQANNTSPVTMRNALRVLEREGLLDIRQGLGSFVASSSEPRTRPYRRSMEIEPSEHVTIPPQETPKPLTTENLQIRLRLFMWTKQRKAEIAFSENPSIEAEARLLQLAGQVKILDILGEAIQENPNDPLLTAGISHLFRREIHTISQYPTLGDALVEAT